MIVIVKTSVFPQLTVDSLRNGSLATRVWRESAQEIRLEYASVADLSKDAVVQAVLQRQRTAPLQVDWDWLWAAPGDVRVL